MFLLGINLYRPIYCYMNIWTYKTKWKEKMKRKNRVSACKQKHFILASCILFLNIWMWVSFKNKEINNILNKKLKKDYEWIQNDNQNVDGVDQHPKAWQSLLPLHWLTFYSITLQFWCCFMSDDCVRLHVEASVVLVSSSLVFFWKFCTEDVY